MRSKVVWKILEIKERISETQGFIMVPSWDNPQEVHPLLISTWDWAIYSRHLDFSKLKEWPLVYKGFDVI